LEECNIAGGEVAMSKRYDIKVPIDPQFQKAPVPIEHSMRFEVASNDYDRLGLTIGPERTFWAGWPWFYELDVALKEDPGKRHEIKRIFLLENIEEQWKWVDTSRNNEVQCLREQASFLQRAVETSGYHSPELLAYNKGLQDYLESISA
jgi:hypothetical protein